MSFRHFILLLPLLFLAFVMNAQDDAVNFEMNLSKEKLGINERLRVEFTMNKDGDDFSPPDFKGFRVLMGPSQAISSSWVNGVRSYSKTYSYTLAPTARGTFNIKQASIVISGKIYKSLAKKVEVTAAVEKPNGQMTIDDFADDNLHLVAEISKTNPSKTPCRFSHAKARSSFSRFELQKERYLSSTALHVIANLHTNKWS